MIKFIFKGLKLLSMGLLVWGTTSCGGNDDPTPATGSGEIPALPTPAYESSSAKYDITSSSSSIKSIELTASGNYIVIGQGQAYPKKSGEKSRGIQTSLLTHTESSSQTRAWNGVISGKFIKISDTEYILEGFGSIVIEGDTDNAFSLQITPDGEETTTVAAKKATTLASSPITDAICRTWSLNTISGYARFGGRVLFNKTMPIRQYDEFWYQFYKAADIYDEFDDEDYEPYGKYPTEAIFTKAGTYMIFYSDETLAVSTWHWVNEENRTLAYSWDYDDPDSFEYGNKVTVNFSGKDLLLKEEPQAEPDPEEDIVDGEAWWIYSMTVSN